MRPTSLPLRGRAARRLVFASCALLPIGALAIPLALCLDSLLAIGRIHRRLASFEPLVEGTRRLAELCGEVRAGARERRSALGYLQEP